MVLCIPRPGLSLHRAKERLRLTARQRITRFGALALAVFALRLVVPAGRVESVLVAAAADPVPSIEARKKPVLQDATGRRFKDSNANGVVDPYEDWRLTADTRVADLIGRMSIEEKAGMMLIDTLSAPPAPKSIGDTDAARFINDEKMTRFIFRNVVGTAAPSAGGAPPAGPRASGAPAAPGAQPGPPGGGAFAAAPVTPKQAAEFTNAVQELAEATRLGIPVMFKSNARNHYERQARQGINEAAGSFSEWPKEAGLAATRDMTLIRSFAETMGAEWRAIGLRGMYGYMADLSTEPRWYRVHETFTEDEDLCAEIMKVLVTGLQGGVVTRNTNVALTIKHFPGGGPQEWGLDPHFTFGKTQVYPAGRFAAHMKPFKAAIDAGASSIMPYYGVPVGAKFEGIAFDALGLAFSKTVVSDLLRGRLGFKGYVNSDTGIITQRAWGLESKTVPERVATALNAGVDVLSGFNKKQTIIDLVKGGLVTEARVNEAVTRLLIEQFNLGLFENPYVDAGAADSVVGKREFRERALEAQRRSVVLLKNANDNVLPLLAPAPGRPVRLYTMGFDPGIAGSAAYGGYQVTPGDRSAENGNARVPVPPGTDYALFRIEVTNPRQVTGTYRSRDETTGGRINPRTKAPWGRDDPDNVDDRLMFGGSLPWENDMLAFSQMAASQSWQVSPSLADVQAVMKEIGDSRKAILCIYFRQPYVLDEPSGLKSAGAILAAFGVSDAALMDVLTGKSNPQGKLPFALASKSEAIVTQASDAPGYALADTLFPFGFGLSYVKTPS
jgi:beta-glucosidase